MGVQGEEAWTTLDFGDGVSAEGPQARIMGNKHFLGQLKRGWDTLDRGNIIKKA